MAGAHDECHRRAPARRRSVQITSVDPLPLVILLFKKAIGIQEEAA